MIRFLQTPGPIKKIVLGGLLVIICAAMVITLVPGGIGSSFGIGTPGKGIVANVDGTEITSVEVQREARARMQQQFPNGSAQASMLLPYFASQAAQNLIVQKTILAEAHRLGLHVTDAEVRDELQHGRYASAFFPDGNFIGEEQYEARLQQADLTVPMFEQSVKDELLFDKVRDLVTGAATASETEIRQQFERENSKVKFDYAVLQKDDIAKTIHPADAELEAFYNQNKPSYANAIPEKRKIHYSLIDNAKLEAQIQVTPEELRDYYFQHQDEFRVPEQVNVRHVLIKTPLPGPDGKTDPAGVEAARKKAEDVLQQVQAGGNFADLAKKYSEDTASAKEGGSLGWIQRGRTVPEFEKVAFSLPKGATSGLVQSSYGFHIIHVDDKQEAHLRTLDEVKGQITPSIKQQKTAQMAEGQASAFLAEARRDGFDKAAAVKGLQVVTTDFVSNTDSLPGMANSQPFMQALFSAPDKSPPDEVQLAQGYAVFELLGIQPAATPTFEQIRSRVETDFKNQRAAALLSQKTQELSDRAKAEHDLKKAAKELGATLKSSDFVLPDGQVPDIGSMSGPASVAFTMKPGDISGPINSGSVGAVLSFLGRQEPSDQDFAAKRDGIRDSLLQSKRAELFGLFVSGLRQQMEKTGKIKINPDEMKSLTRQNSEEGE